MLNKLFSQPQQRWHVWYCRICLDGWYNEKHTLKGAALYILDFGCHEVKHMINICTLNMSSLLTCLTPIPFSCIINILLWIHYNDICKHSHHQTIRFWMMTALIHRTHLKCNWDCNMPQHILSEHGECAVPGHREAGVALPASILKAVRLIELEQNAAHIPKDHWRPSYQDCEKENVPSIQMSCIGSCYIYATQTSVISHILALLIRSSRCQIRSDPIHRSVPDPSR
jgi:hypothetical protein